MRSVCYFLCKILIFRHVCFTKLLEIYCNKNTIYVGENIAMLEAKYKDVILKTIDKLHKRNGRLNVERICHTIQRKYGIDAADIVRDLDKLAAEKVVLKVSFKGDIVYKNATEANKKVSLLIANSYKAESVSLTEPSSKEVEGYFDMEKQNSTSALSEESPNAENNGQYTSNEKNFTQRIEPKHSKDGVEVPKKKQKLYQSSAMSEKPKEKHRLKPGPKPKMKGHHLGAHYDAKGKEVLRGEKSPSPGKKGRPPTKRKRIQKTHGPDFESYVLPRKLTSSSRRRSSAEESETASVVTSQGVTSQGRARCDFCLQTSERNTGGQPEELLICKDCQAKAHPSCMDYSEELARRARTSPWQCIDCKTCYICQDSGDADAMLFCDSCDKGYHMECHRPPIVEKPTGKWVCNKCVMETGTSDNGDNDDRTIVNGSINGDCASPPSLPTPTPPPPRSESPVQFTDRLYHPPPLSVSSSASVQNAFLMSLPSFRRFASRDVPDASSWSVDEVVDFFFEAGFRDECEVFREQEIDGKSLLLMKRIDVLQGLSIKLGPALKIYAHIQRLQTKGSVII